MSMLSLDISGGGLPIAPTVIGLCCSFLGIWLINKLLVPEEELAANYTLQPPEQCAPGWKGKPLGEPTIKVSGSTAIQCYCPATGELLGSVDPATPDGIDRTIAKAAEAQLRWQRSTFAQRRRVLRTLLRFILKNQEPIARAACLDSGKTRVDAVFGEILVTAEKLKWTIDHGEKALRTERRPTNRLMFYKRNEVQYEPLGVVGACVSWKYVKPSFRTCSPTADNAHSYPFHNFMGPVISALFSGNAVVIKNSEQTAWSTAYFASIVKAALTRCKFDENLVHAISCWPDAASYFAAHPGLSHLTFIGSRPIAHEVAKSAAKSLTPLCVELGGKDAAVVLDEPDGKPEHPNEMQRISATLMRGVFQSAGQNCIGIERIVAMPQAYDRLSGLLKERIKNLRPGWDLDEDPDKDGVDMGAMISPASFDRLESLINEAVAQGATLVAGGQRYRHPKYPNAHYFQPTMLSGVTETMRIAQEELFAPVCVLMRAEKLQDVIRIANSTSYGLGCSVFGPTSSTGAKLQLEGITKTVKTGMVAVNDFAVTYAVQLPFGGTKGSGYGRFAGEEGLRSLCNVKSVCVDRFPWAMKTSIPRKLDYPMQAGSFTMGTGVVEFGYADSWLGMYEGVKKML